MEDNRAQSESEHLALSDAVADLGQQHELAQEMALSQDDLQWFIDQGEPASCNQQDGVSVAVNRLPQGETGNAAVP